MKNIKKSMIAALAGVTMTFAMSSQAVPTNIGGVIIDPDHPLDFFATSGNFAQTFTGSLATNDLVIGGYGRIDFLNGTNQATFCPGCELTFVAGAYTQNVGFAPNASGEFEFTGGFVNIYRDAPGNFNLLNGATASDGGLWLSLSSHSIFGINANVQDLLTTLMVTFSGAGATGVGLLDVTGGVAAANFDTNTRFGGSDIEFQNSFTAGSGFRFGSGNFFGDTVVVPEPTSALLLGIGLLGLSFSRRVKK